MKKTVKTIILFLTFLIMTLTTIQFVNLTVANPFVDFNWVKADTNTNPPLISILYPENNSIQNTKVSINLNVTIGESKTASFVRIMDIYYETDWQNSSTSLYHNTGIYIPADPNSITTFGTILNLTNLSNGKHTITIYTVEWGAYIEESNVHMFSINSSSTINFIIDFISPQISILSPINKTYDSPNVSLNFTLNELVSKIKYNLDGQDNFTISGNITMPNLSNGYHNVTVYATDYADNVGSSETLTFTVAKSEPFPTMPITASVGLVAIVGISLLIYFKKYKERK